VDYLAVSNTVNFAEGETNQIVVIPIVNNALVQGNRTVEMALSTPINTLLLTPNQATLTIIDDDHGAGQLSFSTTNFMAAETAGEAIITVTRTNGVTGIATVKFTASGGTALPGMDYAATNGTLVFADGEVNKSFAVRLLRNPLVTGDRTVSLSLSNVTGGAALRHSKPRVVRSSRCSVLVQPITPSASATEPPTSARWREPTICP
jgi:hypothetical protein